MTLHQVTKTAFEQCVGHTFALKGPNVEPTEIRLTAVEGLSPSGQMGSAPDGRRESFSLLFAAPRTWRAPQQIYTLTHPTLGNLDIFLVPIGPDAQGMRLQAIFNFTS